MAIRSRITGVGGYLPPRVVTNDDLAELMDTSDEWITERTGIKQRHWVDPEMIWHSRRRLLLLNQPESTRTTSIC